MAITSRLTIAAVLLTVAGCAGYRIGDRTLFTAEYRTIHVPVFQCKSLRRELGEQLTEAVIKEIERRTPYKVVGDPNADSVLIGEVQGDAKHVVVVPRTGEGREIQYDLNIKVSWLDRRGNPVKPIPPVPVPPEAVDLTATANYVPEVGQSQATAQQTAMARLAEKIVDLMETAW
jgi:hypothetical protein